MFTYQALSQVLQLFPILETTQQMEYYYSPVLNEDLHTNLPKAAQIEKGRAGMCSHFLLSRCPLDLN